MEETGENKGFMMAYKKELKVKDNHYKFDDKMIYLCFLMTYTCKTALCMLFICAILFAGVCECVFISYMSVLISSRIANDRWRWCCGDGEAK